MTFLCTPCTCADCHTAQHANLKTAAITKGITIVTFNYTEITLGISLNQLIYTLRNTSKILQESIFKILHLTFDYIYTSFCAITSTMHLGLEILI